MKGKVYLVSSNNKLPDLLVDLRGQVEIYLRGVISSKHGGLKTVFNNVPDVPVSKFVLNMKGGKKSLLVNSTNTCAKPQRAMLNIKGQNGKKVKNNKFKLNVVSCGQEAQEVARRSVQRRREHRRGWPNSLRAGAPDALSPDRRLREPRRSHARPFPPCCPSWARATS